MQHLDLDRRSSGKIWHRKPNPSSDNGLMVQIGKESSAALKFQGHAIRFLQAGFDASGDRFIAGDHQGNVYVFDLHRNRFQLVQKLGVSCTAIAFTLRRKTEYLVALSDCSLKCYDTDTKEMIACMKGHQTPVHSLSVHASGRYALTTSNDTALLWDLDTFTRKRKLNVKDDVNIVKVFFLPMSNTIMTCFRDDTMFAWESDTLQCKYQLPIPPGDRPHYKAFATPRDGRLLVAGGKCQFLHIWALDTRSLLRVIEMPSKVRAVKQIHFLPESFDGGASQMVGVLSQDGLVCIVHIHSCKLLCDLGSLDDRVIHFTVSPSGRNIVAIMESGRMNIYSIPALLADFNKPPPPLVKATADHNRSSETSRRQRSTLRSMAPSFLGSQSVIGSEVDKKSRADARTGKTVGGTIRVEMDEDDNEISSLPDGLSMNRLAAILKGYGEYPAKYRMFIWRSMLRLPENHVAFSTLVDKGSHLAWAKVHENYPIKSRKLLRVLQRTLSALAHWSALFGEMDYLPLLSFPFIKLFQNNQLVCFEVIATILVNWCQHWFEYFPNPPINILGMVENVLAYHDRKLLEHFVSYDVTSQLYAWPIMQTLFSEVVTKEEWLKLFDHVFTNHPSFLLILVVAYLIGSRGALMACTNKDDFKYFFHHRNAIDINSVIGEAYRIQEGTPDDINPEKLLDDLKPLTKGQYPVFNKYPKFIVDYQAQERERIREDELEYLHQREAAAELHAELTRRRAEEEAWYRQQELLKEAEEQRRVLIAEEEQKLVDQRIRLQAMKRELQMKELQLLDGAQRKFVHHQQNQQETQLRRLDDEIARKSILREQETKAAMDDIEIRRMDLEAQKRKLEQELAKTASSSTYQQRAEAEMRRKREELAERRQARQDESQRDLLHGRRKVVQADVARANLNLAETSMRRDEEVRRRLDDLEKELRNAELSRLNDENQEIEEEVQTVLHRLADAKRDHANRLQQEYDQLKSKSQSGHPSMQDDRREIELRDGRPILNDVSTSTEGSVPISLDRGRQTFEERERRLLHEVRELRRKVAAEAIRKEPPPRYGQEDG
ncbi:TBC1 domain family member 31-like isoform X1 [Lytechinus variegatus]|uniref:TBC1 domain family member 31-like isoform X1 n=1 Tax=Lytechinus variegatus TaxID=7654 RepID=UPI001BB186DE|nr:TBC1 domain family member 31-like isoform X1 [Lytechinus variegatus]